MKPCYRGVSWLNKGKNERPLSQVWREGSFSNQDRRVRGNLWPRRFDGLGNVTRHGGPVGIGLSDAPSDPDEEELEWQTNIRHDLS